MDIAEHKKTGEASKDFPTQLEKMVKERTVELEDAVTKLESEIAERKSVQTNLNQLSWVFRDAADPIIIEDLS